jgi:two-component system, response regulator FlrC
MASMSHEQRLADVEREHILKVVTRCGGNRTHASKILGISIRGLRLKLLGYAQEGVPVPPPGQSDPHNAYWSSSFPPRLGSLTLDG